MGLLNKIRKSVGRVSNRAGSALGGLLTKAGGGMLIKKVAPKLTPGIGTAVTAVSLGMTIDKFAKKTGIPVGPFGGIRMAQKIGGKLFGRAKSAVSKIPRGVKTTAMAVGAVGAGAGLLYGAEQLAEKLGVRGGAGFIGARRRRKARRKYAYIRVQRNRRGKGKLTRNEESRLRSLAKSYSYSEGTSSRRRRKGKGKSMKNYMKWVRSFRGKKKRR